MASATQLSVNDASVFGAIFDPEASLTGTPQITTKPTVSQSYSNYTIQAIRLAEHQALLSINVEEPALWAIQETISELDKLIDAYPLYASAYNNRAQARRMITELEDTANVALNHISSVIEDLTQAIRLAAPVHSNDAVTPEQAKILSSAHTHRGFLLYKASRSEAFRAKLAGVKELQDLDNDTLEEMASKDFSAGGRYGNKLAKQMAVQTNPYAKLCGSIVKEALKKEMETYAAGNSITA